MNNRVQRHQYTKNEIRQIANLWETESIQDIAESLHLERKHVQYVANQIRKAGYPLAKKHKNGVMQSLIKQVFEEK